MDGLAERVADFLPDYEVATSSSRQGLLLTPVSDETRLRRQAGGGAAGAAAVAAARVEEQAAGRGDELVSPSVITFDRLPDGSGRATSGSDLSILGKE